VDRIRAKYGFDRDSMRGYEREIAMTRADSVPRRGRQLLLPLVAD
jgi:hypothetical protein